VGCFNSGTTLLQNILNCHPEISGMPREGVRFTDVLSDLEENGHHMIWDSDYHKYLVPLFDDGDAYEAIKKDWGLFWQQKSKIFLDKSIANTARISWLNRVFPNAYFIGIHRNGYCVTEGLRRRARPPEWYQERFSAQRYSYETIANQWVLSNELIQNDFLNMPNALSISFESLVENPLRVSESCFNFLELEANNISYLGDTLHVSGKQFVIKDPNPLSLKRLDKCGRVVAKPLLEKMMIQLGYDV